MNEAEANIKEWLTEAADVHKLEDGDMIIIRVDEPSVREQRWLWEMFERAVKDMNTATGKNVTVLFLTPGWDVEVVPRMNTKAKLEELLRQMDDAMETCRSCGKVYQKRVGRCPACGLKVRT